MPEKNPTCNRLVDEINELTAEIKRIREIFFKRRDCKDGYKGDWCEHCDMVDLSENICLVDLETAPVYAEDVQKK